MDLKKEVELEVIELTVYEELCRLLEIEPRVEVTPGRDVDDNGEICSWYEDKYYPEFTDKKRKKLLNYILEREEASSLILYVAKLLLEAGRINKEELRGILND